MSDAVIKRTWSVGRVASHPSVRFPGRARSSRRPWARMPLVATLVLVAGAPSVAPAVETLRIPVSRDTWISAYPTEVEGNNGAAPKLKLKGLQEMTLVDLDPAPIGDRRVIAATLHLHLQTPTPLGRVTVSALADDWVEGTGTGYARVEGAAAFAWARTGVARWGGDGPDVTTVSLAARGTPWGFGDATPPDDAGWQVIPVAPPVVEARAAGRAQGFLVIDDVGSEYERDGERFIPRPFPNRFFTSREGPRDRRPYFTIVVDDAPRAVPPPVTPAPAAVAPATLPPEPPPPAGPALPVALRDEFGQPLIALDLAAARGETIGFLVPEAPARVAVRAGPAQVGLFAAATVDGIVDPLVPVGVTAAPAEAAAAGATSTFVEIHVPKDAPTGEHAIELSVAGRTIGGRLTVWNFTLPDRLSFVPQLNAYGLPAADGTAWYRLGHAHRCTLNVLRYNWRGRVDGPPVMEPSGRWDWRAWDARHGPLLDGSAFADLPRGPVPVEVFYLPLNENWPLDHEASFRGGYWVESAYDEAYWEGFRAAAGAIAAHVEERGWHDTLFECYLNNKVTNKKDRWDRSTAAWVFDEPSNTQDFWALRRFGVEFWRGVADHPRALVAYRADISRPQWQRDLLDGVTTEEVISGALREHATAVAARCRRQPVFVSLYGEANRPGTDTVALAAWCVEAWLLGADGVVPWNSIGRAESWSVPDPLALLYPTAAGPVPSLRLKALRSGQQLVEYLAIHAATTGTARPALAAALGAQPEWHARTLKQAEADAGGSAYPEGTHAAVVALRRRIGAALDRAAPPPRERWHDVRPPRPQPGQLPPIVPLPRPRP